jgi:hypothetical protein
MSITHVEVSATGTAGTNKAIVVSSTGIIYTAYIKGDSPSTYVCVAHSHDSGATWTEENLDPVGTSDSGVTLTIDKDDDIHILFNTYVGSAWYLYYQKRTSGTWGSVEQVDTYSSTYNSVYSLVVDSSNEVHVVWERWAGEIIYYRKRTISAWGTTENIQAAGHTIGVNPQISVDSSDTLYIFYGSDGFGTNTDYQNIRCVRKISGGSWVYSQVTDLAENCTIYGNVSIDAGGNVYVCIGHSNTNIYIHKRLDSGGTWESGIQVPTVEYPQAMVINSKGDVYIFWNDDEKAYYILRHNGTWGDATLFYTSEEEDVTITAFTSVSPRIGGISAGRSHNIPSNGFYCIVDEYTSGGEPM